MIDPPPAPPDLGSSDLFFPVGPLPGGTNVRDGFSADGGGLSEGTTGARYGEGIDSDPYASNGIVLDFIT